MDMTDSTLVMVMTKGIGANLTNDEKRAHLIDLKRAHLIDQVCAQEILPPEICSVGEPSVQRQLFDGRSVGFQITPSSAAQP
jgi:hypothetical protein